MTSCEPLYRAGVVRRILAEYGLRPSKGLGQNFLVDKNTVDRILAAAEVTPGDQILEVGPGLGVLTQAFLQRGAAVVAVEKDGRLVRILGELFRGEDALRIVHADALDVDPRQLLPAGGAPCKAVSNLPYYVTTPLLLHLVSAVPPFERIVVMLQREVGDRLTAAPGTEEYGALTVSVAYRAEVASAGIVPPTVFYPAPSVSSQIVVLRPRPCPFPVGREEVFTQVVRAAFGKRRKTLANALRDLPVERERLALALEQAGIDPERRGETLSLAEFAKVSAALSSGPCGII